MKLYYFLLISLFISSCNLIQNNDKLNQSDLIYLENLGLLTKGENVIWFDSQLDKKTSGNFLTNKRIASYWIDKYDKNKSFKHFLMLEDIDSLLLKDLSKSTSHSSYIEIYSKGKNIKVYIDKDSTVLSNYFNKVRGAIK